jgi:hypothetical protein
MGTELDPYVFDSREQMVCLNEFVKQGAYPYGENAHFMLETENWLDYAASAYAGGDGSEENPYLIETAEQLALLAKRVKEGDSYKDKYFKLTKDINLSGRQWIPIGGVREYNKADLSKISWKQGYGNYFSGVFDGGGRTISGLTITRFIHGAALFNMLYGGVVKNVRLDRLRIAMGMNCGGIAVWMEKSKIIDCSVEGKISFLFLCGGIVGSISDSEIVGCFSDLKFYFHLPPYFLLFIEIYDQSNKRAYYNYLLDESEINRRPRINMYSFHYPVIYDGGIAGRVTGNGFIEDCNVRASFYKYSDFPHKGYYGGVWGQGYDITKNCEAIGHDGEMLPLSGDGKVYFKGNLP